MFCDDSSLLSLPSKHCNRACVIFVNFYKSIPVSSMNLGMFSESRREIMSLLELEWFLLARCMTTLSFREFDSCEGIVGGGFCRGKLFVVSFIFWGNINLQLPNISLLI